MPTRTMMKAMIASVYAALGGAFIGWAIHAWWSSVLAMAFGVVVGLSSFRWVWK